MPLSFVRSTLAILWSCFFWQVNIFLPNQVSRILPELRSSSIRKVLPRMRSRNTSWKARLMARHSRISSSLYCSRRQISWHLAHSHFFARRAQSRIPMWPKKKYVGTLALYLSVSFVFVLALLLTVNFSSSDHEGSQHQISAPTATATHNTRSNTFASSTIPQTSSNTQKSSPST